MKRLIILLVALMILPSLVFACSCGKMADFIVSSEKEDLIALVKIISQGRPDSYKGDIDLYMDAEVINILRGNEERKIIRIWGDNGMMCRPYVRAFEIGKEYVMALSLVKNAMSRGEPETDYVISVCGEFSLPFDESTQSVTGPISGKDTQTMTIGQLKQSIKPQPTKD